MNRQAIASAISGGSASSGGIFSSTVNPSVSERNIGGQTHYVGTSGLSPEDAGWYPMSLEWNERYAPGKTIDQAELDRLLKYAIQDKRATQLSGDSGSLYLPDLTVNPDGTGGRPNDAMGLSYQKEWTPIAGFAAAPSADELDSITGRNTAYSVNGKKVVPVHDERGVLTGYKTVAPTPTPEDSWVAQPEIKEEFFETKPTGKYVITDEVDRYERDIAKQWANDAKSGGLFGGDDFFSVVAPIALSFFAGPALAGALGGGIAGGAASGAIIGGASAAITGGDIGKGILTGGVGGGISSAMSGWTPTGNVFADNLIKGGIRGLATGAIRGDAGTGLIGGLVSGGANALLPGTGLMDTIGRTAITGIGTSLLTGNRDASVDAAVGSVGTSSGSSFGVGSVGQNEAQAQTKRQAVANALRAY